jgi:hypothetical protein
VSQGAGSESMTGLTLIEGCGWLWPSQGSSFRNPEERTPNSKALGSEDNRVVRSSQKSGRVEMALSCVFDSFRPQNAQRLGLCPFSKNIYPINILLKKEGVSSCKSILSGSCG